MRWPRLTMLLIAFNIGSLTAGGVVWWRANQCSQDSVGGICLVWVDRGGIHFEPIPR